MNTYWKAEMSDDSWDPILIAIWFMDGSNTIKQIGEWTCHVADYFIGSTVQT